MLTRIVIVSVSRIFALLCTVAAHIAYATVNLLDRVHLFNYYFPLAHLLYAVPVLLFAVLIFCRVRDVASILLLSARLALWARLYTIALSLGASHITGSNLVEQTVGCFAAFSNRKRMSASFCGPHLSSNASAHVCWDFLAIIGICPKASNRTMEPTASRRTIQLYMISSLHSAAMRALARGGSSCSRFDGMSTLVNVVRGALSTALIAVACSAVAGGALFAFSLISERGFFIVVVAFAIGGLAQGAYNAWSTSSSRGGSQ